MKAYLLDFYIPFECVYDQWSHSPVDEDDEATPSEIVNLYKLKNHLTEVTLQCLISSVGNVIPAFFSSKIKLKVLFGGEVVQVLWNRVVW